MPQLEFNDELVELACDDADDPASANVAGRREGRSFWQETTSIQPPTIASAPDR